MATTSTNFIPELWSQQLIEQMKESIIFGGMPKRDKYSQMLRDKALGRPEYPEKTPRNMTATEVNIRYEYATRAAEAMAANIDNHILDSLRYRAGP